MADKGNNPLNPLMDVGLRPEDKAQMRGNLLQIMREEESELPSPRPVVGKRNMQRVTNFFAGAAAVVLVAGVLLVGTHNHWFQRKVETAQKHPAKSTVVNRPAKSQPQQVVGVPIGQLTGIHMNSLSDGWATQNPTGATLQLIHTTDGGETWQDVTPAIKTVGGVDVTTLNPVKQNEFTATFPSANHAVLAWAVPRGNSGNQLVADNILIETTMNGGHTWATSEITDSLMGFGERPVALDFINNKDGWLTTMPTDGGGVMFIREALYKTTDGGVHWTKVSQTNLSKAGTLPSTNASPEEGWVSLINQQVGFALKEPPTQTDMLNAAKPSLYRTTDGGATWSPATMPSLPQPYHVGMNRVLPPQAFGNKVIFPVVTETANPDTYTLSMYVSNDDGKSFAKERGTVSFTEHVRLPMQYGFWDAQNGWFWLDGVFYTTTDGGQTISKVNTDHVFNKPSDNSVISWQNQSTALVTTQNSIWETTDGGQHWVKYISSASQ